MSLAGFFTSWDRFVEELKLRFGLVEHSSCEEQSNNSILVPEFESNAHSATDLKIESEVDESNGEIVQTVSDTDGDKFACSENFIESDLQVSEVGNEVNKSEAEFAMLDRQIEESELNGSQVTVSSVSGGGNEHKDSSGKSNRVNKIAETMVICPMYKLPSEEIKLKQRVDGNTNDLLLAKCDKSGLGTVNSDFVEGAMLAKELVDRADNHVEGMIIELLAAGICCFKSNLASLKIVFDPGGYGIFNVQPPIADIFLGVHFSRDKLALQTLWTSFKALGSYLRERTRSKCTKSFFAIAIILAEFDGVLFVGGGVGILKLFVDYRELLSWIDDLEGKVNLKGRAFVTNKSLRSNMKNF